MSRFRWAWPVSVAFIFSIAIYAATAADLLQEAESSIEKEQFVKAETLLGQAVRLEPENVQVLYRLGYVRFRQRKLIAARQSFTKVLSLAPPAYNSRYFLGRIALLESKQREAIEWLEPIVQANQAIFDTHAQIASAYAATGQSAKAIAALRTAISQAPWDGALHYRLGQIHKQLGQVELAAQEFGNSTRLKNLNREDVETLMQVSQSLQERQRDAAIRTGEKISGRTDTDPETMIALGVLYGTADLKQEALAAFEAAAQRNGELFQAQFNKGLALLKLNRVDDAIPSLERAATLLPQSAEANITLGLAQAMKQNYREAIPPLARGWKMDSSNPRVGALLATAYLRTSDAAKAVPILRSIAQGNSSEPSAQTLLVEALNATEDTAGALKAAQVAAERFPELPPAQLALAQQLARLGRYQDARAPFEAVLRLLPGQPEAELGLADTFQKSGQHPQAVEHYRVAMNGQTTELAARIGSARSLVAMAKLDEAAALLEQALPAHPENATIRLELSRIYARSGKPDLAAEQAKIAEKLRAANP